jgi:translation initiation factor 1
MGKKADANPWMVLQPLRDKLPPGDKPAAPERAAPPPPKPPARAVVRIERKQRGGKEVTVIEKLGLPADQLETWCKDLKASLGCGGVVEGDAILLQGDLRSRLEAVLTKRGVGKITIAS